MGYYFGRVDTTLEEKEDRKAILLNSKNLIYMNMFLANKQDVVGKKTNNPHWALTGDTGSGKSVTAKNYLWNAPHSKIEYCILIRKRNATTVYVHDQ
ncbi:ATP-binding protein [Enterococcus mundtii]|nr:ATP-binding protein [Enterococcus mundtii]